MNIGDLVKNKRSGRCGVIVRLFKSGSIAVLEKVSPIVINTHDNSDTLEVIEDNTIDIFDETK